METKYKAMGFVGVVLVSAAVGRYTAPEKVKIETKTVEVIKEVKVTDETKTKNRDRITTGVTDTKPDGEKIETITVIEKDADSTKTDVTTTRDDSKSTDQIKEVTKSTGRLNLSVLAGVNVTNPGNGMLYGGNISRDILGPISLGAWGLTNGIGGVSVGITF